MAQQPRQGGTTLLWGLLFGFVLALLILLDRFFVAGQLRHAGLGTGLVSLLLSRGVLYVVGLALFFLGGLLAARRSGVMESGLFAGLLAGGIAGLTNLALVVLAAGAVNRRLQSAAAARHLLPALRAAGGTSIFSAVATCIAVSLIGAGVGALGGLAGRGSGRHGQSFQGGGAPGTFGYPPQPVMSTPAGGSYVPPMPPPDYTPVAPPSGGYNPPMPPGYVPGNDSPTIQTSWT
jgi:hypothetical protein